MQGKGLSGSYKFTRGPCIYSTSMVAVEVMLANNSEAPIANICVGEKVSYLESTQNSTFFSLLEILHSCENFTEFSMPLMFYRN